MAVLCRLGLRHGRVLTPLRLPLTRLLCSSGSTQDARPTNDDILRDLQPIHLLLKKVLHSARYMDGECLTPGDEKAVVERLLAYHPCSEDKIGCGLQSIMVDRHPDFNDTRCLFVVRTDGGLVDFSYQKCLREYVRKKYPARAESFTREKLGFRVDHIHKRLHLQQRGRLCGD